MEDAFLEKLKIFGENVKRIRLEKGITIEELSKSTKISKRFLERIEIGDAKRVSSYHLFIISKALNVLPHLLCKNL